MLNIKKTIWVLGFSCLLFAGLAAAQEAGTAGGKGEIDRFIPGDEMGGTEAVPFSPRYSYAYVEGTGDKKFYWLVLTDAEPPLKELQGAPNREEARRVWCQEGKSSFVAVKLDSKWAVDLYFLCTAKGHVNMEMLSTINDLASVVLNFEVKSESRLKGTLKGGQGSCPDEQGNNKYCTQRSDYTFDAPVI